MHDLLEGALQYEIKLMLKAMVQEDKYFSLGKANRTIHTVIIIHVEEI